MFVSHYVAVQRISAGRKYNRVRRLTLHRGLAVSMTTAPPSGVLGPPGPIASAGSPLSNRTLLARPRPAGHADCADGNRTCAREVSAFFPNKIHQWLQEQQQG